MKEFDQAFSGHVAQVLSNAVRALWYGLTASKAGGAPGDSQTKKMYRKLNRYSACLSLFADAAMMTLGGRLKFKESLSGRLGDVLSHIYIAAQFGSLSIAKYLLPFVDPKANRSIALVWAADSGYVDMVKFLLPLSDASERESQALRWAASNDHVECVRALIPHSNPCAEESEALYWAARNKCQATFDLLYPASDPKAALSRRLRFGSSTDNLDLLKERIKIDDEKELLFEKTKHAFDKKPTPIKSKI